MSFPEPPSSGLTPIREAVGQRVDVTGIEVVDGMPIAALTDGRRLLCSTPWAAAGATYMQGELAANGGTPLAVMVVDERDQVGFRPVREGGTP